MDIGRINSYIKINNFLLNLKGKNNIIGNNIKNEGIINKSSIGNNVNIGCKSNIESSIIFNNVVIGKNVFIKDSIIGENCCILDNLNIIKSVIGDNEIIKNLKNITNENIWTKSIPEGYPKKQIGNVIGE
jgi:NDP-sugar pyrophosphorylase family protein